MARYAARFIAEHPIECWGMFLAGAACAYVILSWLNKKREDI